MNIYQIWVDLAPGVSDLDFVDSLRAYLGYLAERGKLSGFRVLRRKLGFGPEGLGEFAISLEFNDLAQIDDAFSTAAARTGEAEKLHFDVFFKVRNFRSALYRDFPDPVRVAL